MTGIRVPNDPGGEPGGALSELLRLQSHFQARLAEETISYLRRLQGASAPNAPGTVLLPEPGTVLEGRGAPGSAIDLALEVENRQRVHCMVTPLLGTLVDAAGVTWTPAAQVAPVSQLVGPSELTRLELTVAVPAELPAGIYRGALVLQGFREGGVPVAIAVGEAKPAPSAAAKSAKRSRASGAKRAKPARSSGSTASKRTRATGGESSGAGEKPATATRRAVT